MLKGLRLRLRSKGKLGPGREKTKRAREREWDRDEWNSTIIGFIIINFIPFYLFPLQISPNSQRNTPTTIIMLLPLFLYVPTSKSKRAPNKQDEKKAKNKKSSEMMILPLDLVALICLEIRDAFFKPFYKKSWIIRTHPPFVEYTHQCENGSIRGCV